MRAHECFHCKQWVEEGEEHDCWTTTEAALTKHLSEDLQEAWARLRETAVEFGDQRIYASHHSIMFARKSCYFFVRPQTKHLEICVFLGRPVNAPQIRKVIRTSKRRLAHLLRVTHRDEVEAPITDWLREAYEFEATPKQVGKSTRRKVAKSESREVGKSAGRRVGKSRTGKSPNRKAAGAR